MAAARWEKELTALERDVRKEYPDLRLVACDGTLLFRGSFPIRHQGEDLDRFLIEISFPEGPFRLPAIKEIGGRIPRIDDRHINRYTGEICTDVPELILLQNKYTLLGYLEGAVRNFFISQHLVEKGEQWPFDQWDHGSKGLVQAYGSLLGVDGRDQLVAFLDCLSHKKIKGHWTCPCGSGRKVRDCHGPKLRELHDRIPPRIARSALTRLQTN